MRFNCRFAGDHKGKCCYLFFPLSLSFTLSLSLFLFSSFSFLYFFLFFSLFFSFSPFLSSFPFLSSIHQIVFFFKLYLTLLFIMSYVTFSMVHESHGHVLGDTLHTTWLLCHVSFSHGAMSHHPHVSLDTQCLEKRKIPIISEFNEIQLGN